MSLVIGRDAAFPTDIGTFAGVCAGYYGGPDAYNVWKESDWMNFRQNRKLPIWVSGDNGEEEAAAAINALRQLHVPPSIPTAIDMEARVDSTYVTAFGRFMQKAGYRVLVYGSLSTVFGNPRLNGYWVADWTGQEHMAINPNTGNSRGVRGTQYASLPDYDISAWKQWVVNSMWL